MTLARKLSGVWEELRRDNSAAAKVFRLAQRGTHATGIAPAVSVERCVMVEIGKPPPLLKGLRDLVVRRGDERDLDGIAAVNHADPALIRARLSRGDMVWLGQIGDRIVCHTWFHAGPSPFDEERRLFALWALDETTFWSYDAVSLPEARSTGVFVKVIQTGLRDVFERLGARRVRGFIHDTNQPSLVTHRRMGFTTIGTVTAVAMLGLKAIRWESGGTRRQWVLRRDSDFALPPP